MKNGSAAHMVMRDELRVEAILENVRRIGEFVRGFGRCLGLTEDTLFDIDLAVEEASTNTVRHAYGSGPAGDILVQLKAEDDAVIITLTDWGLPFKAEVSMPPDVGASLETRTRGGMGLHLIYGLMDSVTRKTASAPGGPNMLVLTKQILD